MYVGSWYPCENSFRYGFCRETRPNKTRNLVEKNCFPNKIRLA